MIVEVEVNNRGSDMGQMPPMYRKVVGRYGVTPRDYPVDGGFIKASDIEAMAAGGTSVYGPVKNAARDSAAGADPYEPKEGDTEAMGDFRRRMGTEAARAWDRDRPSIAEYPSAGCRNRNLHQFATRGLRGIFAETLWQALVHNFQRFKALGFLEVLMGAGPAGTPTGRPAGADPESTNRGRCERPEADPEELFTASPHYPVAMVRRPVVPPSRVRRLSQDDRTTPPGGTLSAATLYS